MTDQIDRTCKICGKAIHPERILAIPNAKTCSRACAGALQQRSHIESNRRRRAARKAQATEEAGT